MAATITLIFAFLFLAPLLAAQELECEVSVNTQQLTTEALDNISDFSAQVKQYLNTTRWTKEDFGSDRIKCALTIFIKNSPSTGRYAAQVFIGSQRRIWDLRSNRPTDKNSAMVRIFEDSWEFSYTRGISLTRNEYRLDPLTSFLDFYAYLILGFDYDSYQPLAGSPYFQKALDIFSLSRSAGPPKGWEFPGSGTYSKTRLIDELTNEKFKVFREALYTYHTEGLDRIAENKSAALVKILEAVESIAKVKQRINQQSVAIKAFFDTKYLELCELFLTYSDPGVYRRLSLIDPSHQKSYEEYLVKRK